MLDMKGWRPSAVVRAVQKLRALHRAVGDPNVLPAGTPQVVAATASPMSYVNNSQGVEELYFTIPTGVTATLARGGITLASTLTPAATTMEMFALLGPGQTIVFTYSAGAPTITRDVH